MTEQTGFAIETQNPTRWQKVVAWLSAFEEAMNYDPQANTDATIGKLRQGVARLESRVIELERSNQQST